MKWTMAIMTGTQLLFGLVQVANIWRFDVIDARLTMQRRAIGIQVETISRLEDMIRDMRSRYFEPPAIGKRDI